MTESAPTLLPEPAIEEIRLAAVLHALADPMRLRIALQLADGHQDMACIAFDLPVSKSTTTHHFRVLRESGVIRQHRRGTSRVSTLRAADLEQVLPGVLDRVLAAARTEARAEARGTSGDAPTME
ncbi:helix-turn-helix transcriptional regulator [Kitasatospora viridis]|uniref:ArsR family transcriptional regulator n=1 Tax=Kitasatospora viridis TaxID=281105 RepID=A0A561UP82_9ACTN|nr:ArsR family transcriptional regulator [Kitasatospora viridis]